MEEPQVSINSTTSSSSANWIAVGVTIVVLAVAGVLTWMFWPKDKPVVVDPPSVPPVDNSDDSAIVKVLEESPWRPYSVLYPRDTPISVSIQTDSGLVAQDPTETQSATISSLTSSRNGTYVLQYLESGFDEIDEAIIEYTSGTIIHLSESFSYPYKNNRGFDVNNDGTIVIVGVLSGTTVTNNRGKVVLIRGTTITGIDGSTTISNDSDDTELPLDVLCSKNYLYLRYVDKIERRSLASPASNIVTMNIPTTFFGYLKEDEIVTVQGNGAIKVTNVSDPFNYKIVFTISLSGVTQFSTSETRIAATTNQKVWVYKRDVLTDAFQTPVIGTYGNLTTNYGSYISVSDNFLAVGSNQTVWVYELNDDDDIKNELDDPQWLSAQEITSVSISDSRLHFTDPNRNRIVTLSHT